ncbi:MAG: carbonic anhydrase [Verrucomicrobiales bacterium]|nr:carbonic anhydrase [Verrucomicrobiales bacterium]|tara:strand:+ start:2764 stop:3426 length:663 start_codon:yes stop_codon:yes gene_type:complete
MSELDPCQVVTKDIQNDASPDDILALLTAGNQRFRYNNMASRKHSDDVVATAGGQAPLAVVLACMDSRVGPEVIFDAGVGDIFSIRVAGNIVSSEALGSMEYGCGVAGSKVVIVIGHTRCGAVNATIDLMGKDAVGETGLGNIASVTGPIGRAVEQETSESDDRSSQNEDFSIRVTELNVLQTIKDIREKSSVIDKLASGDDFKIVGAVYDVRNGEVRFL